MPITEVHENGTPHLANWESVDIQKTDGGEFLVDVWCDTCGQSGSFFLDVAAINPHIQWYP